MKLMEPASCTVELAPGALRGGTGRYQKHWRDMAGLYADTGAFARRLAQGADDLTYEVGEFRPSARPGDMIFGVTRLLPGRIGDEFAFTRGHIHAVADRPEIYYGQKGEGLMLLESPDGETRIVPVGAQTICYVPPFWLHRSINVGADDVVMVFAYPADAGQDYDIIARAGGMRVRVLADGAGGWREVPNPDWRPRDPEELRRLAAGAFAETDPRS
jgi:glucose-6-phosphate isomerase, archaeal